MRQEPDPVVRLVLAGVGILFLLMLRPWRHWDAIVSAPEWFWGWIVYHWSAFWQGMTTHGLVAGIVAFLLLGPVGLLIGWITGRGLAEGKTSRSEARVEKAERRAEEAERQAAEERQKRIEAETVARQAVADKTEAERLYDGLIGQFHQAIGLADRRGEDLKKMRAKRRAERGELPVRPVEETIELTTNGQDKKPRDTQGKKRPSKSRSPKRSRLPPRLPRR